MFNQFRIPPWVHCLPCITEESTSMPLFHRSARSRSPSMPAIEKISSCVEESQQGKVSITSPPRIPCAVSLSVGYIPMLHLPIPYSLCKSRTPIRTPSVYRCYSCPTRGHVMKSCLLSLVINLLTIFSYVIGSIVGSFTRIISYVSFTGVTSCIRTEL